MAFTGAMHLAKRLRVPLPFGLCMGSALNMWPRKQQVTYFETHADKAGLTSGRQGWAGMDADGNVDSMRSASDGTVAKLGRPGHISCCPTGTLEFAGDEADCLSAVQATVKALTQQISTQPPKILILYGSLRQDSYSRRVAVESARVLASYGADVRVFDPQGLPLFSQDVDPSDPKVSELRSLTRWCQGMIWISPEVHGNFSAVFKNQIDWMPLSEGAIRPTQGKTVAVMQVEAGSQSFNTVNNLRTLGRWMRCIVIPNQSSIPQAYKEFNEDGTLKDGPFRSRIVDVLEELFKYTLLLRDQQPYLVERYSEKKAEHEKNLAKTKAAANEENLRSLQSPVVIDVRSAKEVSAEKGGRAVNHSFHVPLNVDGQPQSVHETTAQEFKKKLEAAGVELPLNKDAAFITHCTAGDTPYIGRGARAAALLRDLGYRNSHNGGSADAIRNALGP